MKKATTVDVALFARTTTRKKATSIFVAEFWDIMHMAFVINITNQEKSHLHLTPPYDYIFITEDCGRRKV